MYSEKMFNFYSFSIDCSRVRRVDFLSNLIPNDREPSIVSFGDWFNCNTDNYNTLPQRPKKTVRQLQIRWFASSIRTLDIVSTEILDNLDNSNFEIPYITFLNRGNIHDTMGLHDMMRDWSTDLQMYKDGMNLAYTYLTKVHNRLLTAHSRGFRFAVRNSHFPEWRASDYEDFNDWEGKDFTNDENGLTQHVHVIGNSQNICRKNYCDFGYLFDSNLTYETKMLNGQYTRYLMPEEMLTNLRKIKHFSLNDKQSYGYVLLELHTHGPFTNIVTKCRAVDIFHKSHMVYDAKPSKSTTLDTTVIVSDEDSQNERDDIIAENNYDFSFTEIEKNIIYYEFFTENNALLFVLFVTTGFQTEVVPLSYDTFVDDSFTLVRYFSTRNNSLRGLFLPGTARSTNFLTPAMIARGGYEFDYKRATFEHNLLKNNNRQDIVSINS